MIDASREGGGHCNHSDETSASILPAFKHRFRGQTPHYASVSDGKKQRGTSVTPFVRMNEGMLYVEGSSYRVQACI